MPGKKISQLNSEIIQVQWYKAIDTYKKDRNRNPKRKPLLIEIGMFGYCRTI